MNKELLETDLLIVGGGPAGLTAAIYGARMGLKVNLFEAEAFGGLIRTTSKIENYPGFSCISGVELAEKIRNQAQNCGADLRIDSVALIDPEEMLVTTSDGIWKTKAIIIATGVKHQKLGLSNESELVDNGVSYCATCDGPLYSGKRVAVVGGGNTAALEALFLLGLARQVYLIYEESQLKAKKVLSDQILNHKNISPMFNCKIEEAIPKDGKLRKILVKNLKTGEVSEIKTRALFIALGAPSLDSLAKVAGISTESGRIVVNNNQETNLEGIFAAGDITGGVKQITTAVGEATTAALSAIRYVKKIKRLEKN